MLWLAYKGSSVDFANLINFNLFVGTNPSSFDGLIEFILVPYFDSVGLCEG